MSFGSCFSKLLQLLDEESNSMCRFSRLVGRSQNYENGFFNLNQIVKNTNLLFGICEQISSIFVPEGGILNFFSKPLGKNFYKSFSFQIYIYFFIFRAENNPIESHSLVHATANFMIMLCVVMCVLNHMWSAFTKEAVMVLPASYYKVIWIILVA